MHLKKLWIKQIVLILSGININIETEIYFPSPPLCLCLKITHRIEELLLNLLIIFEYLREKGKGFQHVG